MVPGDVDPYLHLEAGEDEECKTDFHLKVSLVLEDLNRGLNGLKRAQKCF